MDSTKRFRYAFSVLFDEDDDKVYAFVDRMEKKFHEATENKYLAVCKLTSMLGKRKLDLLEDIVENSCMVVIVFSPHYQRDQYNKHKQEYTFLSRLGEEKIIPISLFDTPLPSHFIVINGIKFTQNWEDEKRKWDSLINALCHYTKHVLPKEQIADKPMNVGDSGANAPLTEADLAQDFPTDVQNMELAGLFGIDKHRLAISLTFTQPQIEQFEHDYPKIQTQIYYMFYKWRVKNSKKSNKERYELLKQVFGKIERKDAIKTLDKLYEKYNKELVAKSSTESGDTGHNPIGTAPNNPLTNDEPMEDDQQSLGDLISKDQGSRPSARLTLEHRWPPSSMPDAVNNDELHLSGPISAEQHE